MDFVDFLYRIKQELDLKQDKDVAAFLGLGSGAFSARKTRNSIPDSHLKMAALAHPEMHIDVEYILTGKRSNVENSTNIVDRNELALSDEEQKLLAMFRQLNPEARAAVFGMMQPLLPKKPAASESGEVA